MLGSHSTGSERMMKCWSGERHNAGRAVRRVHGGDTGPGPEGHQRILSSERTSRAQVWKEGSGSVRNGLKEAQLETGARCPDCWDDSRMQQRGQGEEDRFKKHFTN